LARGRKFEDAFNETVKYIFENNSPLAQVAREIGVNENTLHGKLLSN
jgi:transposase